MSLTPEPLPDYQACPDAPDHIWLQFDDDGEQAPQWDGEGVTWCSDKINDNDVLYVRADHHTTLRAAIQAQAEEAAKLMAQRDELLDELRNFVAAKRFSREHFDSQLEFADWLVSRARHAITNATDHIARAGK